MDPSLPVDFHVTGGFLATQQLARHMNVMIHVQEMFNYIERFWMDTIGPTGFSVYGFNIRTNNYIESFHSMLNTTIGQHPPVWTFYGKLRFNPWFDMKILVFLITDRLHSIESRVRRETRQLINRQQV